MKQRKKEHISEPRSGVVDLYNKAMGCVDLAVMLLPLYYINLNPIKCYLRVNYFY